MGRGLSWCLKDKNGNTRGSGICASLPETSFLLHDFLTVWNAQQPVELWLGITANNVAYDFFPNDVDQAEVSCTLSSSNLDPVGPVDIEVSYGSLASTGVTVSGEAASNAVSGFFALALGSHKVIYDNLASFPPDATFYPTDQQEFDEEEEFWLSVTAPEGWRLTGVTRNSIPIDVPAGGAISLDHQDAMGTEDIHFTLEFQELDDWAKGLKFVGISSSGKAYTHDFVGSAEEAWNAWPILDDVDNEAETPINTAILRSTDGKALAPGVYRLYVDADPDPGLFSEVLVPAGNGAKSIGFPLGTGIPYSKLGGYWEIVYVEEEEKGVPGPLIDPFPVTPDEPPAPPPDEPDEEIEYLPTPEIPELPDPEIPELPTLSGTCTDPCLCDIAALLQCLCSRLSCLDQHLVQVGNLVANTLYSHGVAVVGGLNRVGENVDQIRSSVEEGVSDLVDASGELSDDLVQGLGDLEEKVEALDPGVFLEVSENMSVVSDDRFEDERREFW